MTSSTNEELKEEDVCSCCERTTSEGADIFWSWDEDRFICVACYDGVGIECDS